MLRQLALTAKRTMTRADDVNGGVDKGAAIRERLLRLIAIRCRSLVLITDLRKLLDTSVPSISVT